MHTADAGSAGASSSEASSPESFPALAPSVDLARWYHAGSRRFRIPALTRTTAGTLLAVFDARPTQQDIPSHIHLVARRSHDQGRTWGPLEMVHRDPVWSAGDPSLLVDRLTGRLFCFAASGIEAGFGGAGTGNDHDDGTIMQADLLVSDDDGGTWTHRRITEQVKEPSWQGFFAASGEGIQLRRGPHAGRLLQQYVVRVDGANFAMTAYSDDHGETWQRSDLVGPGADENKVVECSDGSVLLNSRAAPRRLQARSTDGGATWSEPAPVPEQIDPGNNGAIIRPFPDADPSDPRARLMLLSHTADPSMRRGLVLRWSVDDGRTWTGAVTVEPDAAEYSTLTPLGEGRVGLLYERESYATLTYRTVDVRALPISPVLLERADGRGVTAGRSTDVPVHLVNLGHVAARSVEVSVEGPDGITAPVVQAGSLAPGEEREVLVPVSVPAGRAGPREVTLRAVVDLADPMLPEGPTRALSTRPARIDVQAFGAPLAELEVTAVLDAAYPEDDDSFDLVGDRALPWARVRNAGSVPVRDIHVRSSAGGDGATIDLLEPGVSHTFSYGDALAHRLTEEDVRRGIWTTRISAQGTSELGEVAAHVDLTPIDLTERPPVPAQARLR